MGVIVLASTVQKNIKSYFLLLDDALKGTDLITKA